MTNSFGAVYYVFGFVVTLWLVFVSVLARLQGRACSRSTVFGLGAGVLVLSLLPLGGLPVWRWGLSIWPNPSVPFVGLICLALWPRLGGSAWFAPSDRRATWLFGAVAGTALAVQTLSPVAIDLYGWGWEGATAVGVTALLAVVSFARGNRFGALLLAAMIAWALGALESLNLWDYLVDPVYWLVSLGGGLRTWQTRGRACRCSPPLTPITPS